MTSTSLAELVDRLRQARHVFVLTGSGISAESGVPTFREAQTGLWSRYSPQQLATPEAFNRDPETVWQWYAWRREILATVQPNAAHYAVARLQALVPKLTLVTQNVDGLHQKAGASNVLEFHGNLMTNRCSRDGSVQVVSTETSAAPPRCPDCGAYLRPGVVWFGEPIPADVLQRSFDAAMECDVYLSIGTSSMVYPAASLVEAAIQNDATIVEVNPEATPLTRYVDYALARKAGDILPELISRFAVELGATGANYPC